MNLRAVARLVFVPVLALLSACTIAGNDRLERLDERAGVMLTRAREPLVFARTEPRYSRSARDYLYLGPVETNRQGVREYFLWVGIATTLDRGFIAPPAELPSTLFVTIEGEPIELPLERWHDVVRTEIKEPVYATAVPIGAELAARVTLHQLGLLEAARLETVTVAAEPAGTGRAYRRWHRTVSFGDFLGSAAIR
jgi:hypothetical protein